MLILLIELATNAIIIRLLGNIYISTVTVTVATCALLDFRVSLDSGLPGFLSFRFPGWLGFRVAWFNFITNARY